MVLTYGVASSGCQPMRCWRASAGQLDQHLPRALRALRLRQRQEGVAPFGGFRGIGVVRRRGQRGIEGGVEQQGTHVVRRNRGVHVGTLGRERKN
jgi:hypothetical protein